jgi:hypothetical protein
MICRSAGTRTQVHVPVTHAPPPLRDSASFPEMSTYNFYECRKRARLFRKCRMFDEYDGFVFESGLARKA